MFKISLGLNFGLLGAVLVLLPGRQNISLQATPAQPSVNQPALPDAAASPESAPLHRFEVEPFSWAKKIEAPDYPTYISNLRKIGCPEQTIRDIITADVDSLYQPQRQPLEKELNAAVLAKKQSLQLQLDALRKEEASLVAALLGPAPGESAPEAATVATSPRPRRQQHPQEVTMPLFFQQVDVSGLNLGLGQTQAIESLRQRFVEEVGGTNQDPNDPEYKKRWMKVQPEYDDMLRGMIGNTAFQQYQIASRMQQPVQ